MPIFLLIFCVDFPSFCEGKIKRRISPISGKLRRCLMCFAGDGAGGFLPPVLLARAIGPGPGVRHTICMEQNCFRMKREETKRNSTTGTMKTIKIAAGKMHFPTAYFFVFPGCFASGWRHSAAGPWWRAPVAHPTRKVTIFFCKEFFRVSWRGDDNPSGPTGQLPLHKGAIFSCFSGKMFDK